MNPDQDRKNNVCPAQGPSSNKALMYSQRGILVFLGICFTWLIWNTTNAFPAVDDFCYGARANRDGILGSVASEYMSWGGRYTATLLISAFASSREILLNGYFLAPLAILAANFLAVSHFLNKTGIPTKSYKFVFFAIAIALFSFREAVFWMAGGFTYGIGCALFLVLIAEEFGIFLQARKHEDPPSWARTFMLSGASLVLAGFNETLMVAHAALLSLLFSFCVVARRKNGVIFRTGIILAFAILGALIVINAPGNLAREATLAPPALFRSMGKSFLWIFERYTHVFLGCWLLFYSSLIVFNPLQKNTLEKSEFRMIAAALFITLWAALFTRAYALNGSGPSRVHTVDLLLVSLLAFHAARHVYSANREAVFQSRKLMPIFMSFVGIFITAVTLRAGADGVSFTDTLTSLKYSRPLKQSMDARFKQAEHAPGASLEVSRYPDKTRSMTFFDDIQPDAKDWRNVCFADYFHLKDVRLEE